MENNYRKESNESFESLTLPLANFVEYAIDLPHCETFKFQARNYKLGYKTRKAIKSNIKAYLGNSYYISTLEHWLNLLQNISDDSIAESYPDIPDWNTGAIMFSCEEDRKKLKKYIEGVIGFINGILQTHYRLTPPTANSSSSSFNTEVRNENTSTEEPLILDIFEYLKDYGYMDISEWEALKNYLCLFVENEFEIPEIEAKLKIPSIDRWEFYYLFKILNSRLMDIGKKPKLRYFEEFIRNVFPIDIKTLRNKLSEYPLNKTYSRGFPEKYKWR